MDNKNPKSITQVLHCEMNAKGCNQDYRGALISDAYVFEVLATTTRKGLFMIGHNHDATSKPPKSMKNYLGRPKFPVSSPSAAIEETQAGQLFAHRPKIVNLFHGHSQFEDILDSDGFLYRKNIKASTSHKSVYNCINCKSGCTGRIDSTRSTCGRQIHYRKINMHLLNPEQSCRTSGQQVITSTKYFVCGIYIRQSTMSQMLYFLDLDHNDSWCGSTH